MIKLPSAKYRLLLLVALLLPVVCLCVWWVAPHESDAPAEQGMWLPVTPQQLENQLGLVGRIQAAQQQTLSAPFEGVIREIAVHEGQRVERGQILLVLDPNLVTIQLRQAQAELLKAQKEVALFRNWSRSPDVSRAKRVMQAALATLNNTQASLRDTNALFKRGIVARMEVDTLEQQMRTQQQELDAAQDELRMVEARGKGEDSQIADMELANAQARYTTLLEQVEKKTVRAPFSGFIVRPLSAESGKPVTVQPGLSVSAGAPLLTVMGLDTMQVVTRVEEADLHQLKEGMPVEITGEGFAGRVLSGQIREIGIQNSANESQGAYYDVIVSVDTPLADLQHDIRLGMSARLAVITYRNEQGFAVPAQALHLDPQTGSRWVLWRASANTVPRKVEVRIGQAVAQGVEINGIEAGDVRVDKHAQSQAAVSIH
jgi:multidrug efflux pump subunit AcrA (membrane-fusion protein)